MKTKSYYPIIIPALIASVFAACQKGVISKTNGITTTTTTPSATVSASTVLSTGSIAIGTTLSLASTTPFAAVDSIYLKNCFPPKGKKDSVAFSALPAAIGTYLTANYSGYTFTKAFSITDSTKTVINYIVVIKYNGNLIGLKFTTAGVFVSVQELCAGADLGGAPGFHPGGPFDNRSGNPDTVALSAIPAVVQTYFTTTYATDTLLHAAIAPDGSYILISKNKTLFATDITATGTFISRMQIPGPPAVHTSVLQANLPSAITTYLTATYPGYVFDKAFSASNKSGIIGYEVFITSNNTKYAVTFDATGTFVKAIAVH